MADFTESNWFQTVIAVGLGLALIGLIGYARRGIESEDGQAPGEDVVVVVDRD